MIGFVSAAYTPPNYNNVTIILKSSYTPPNYNNVTIVLGVSMDYIVNLPLGFIRYLNCSPDFENPQSQPEGQSSSVWALNVTNDGTITEDMQIRINQTAATGWQLFSSPYTTCYQETANQSTAGDGNCGLDYSGKYYIDSSDYSNMNYTTFSKAIGAIWQVKHGNSTNAIPYNVTIPTGCWNPTIALRFYTSQISGGSISSYGQCYNYTSGSYVTITNVYTSTRSSGETKWQEGTGREFDGNWSSWGSAPFTYELYDIDRDYNTNFYEEAMIWNNPVALNTNYQTIFNSVNPGETKHVWLYANCSFINSNSRTYIEMRGV